MRQVLLSAGFWTDPRVGRLTFQARLVYLYLMAGPQGDVSGIFAFSIGEAEDHLAISRGAIQEAMRELSRERMIEFDLDAGSVWLRLSFLAPATGELHEKHAVSQAARLPSRRIARDFLESRVALGRQRGLEGASRKSEP